MIYLIDYDKLIFEIYKNYKDISSCIDADILTKFINNYDLLVNNTDISLNIEFINNFKNNYRKEFEYLMNITGQRTV